nr:hypothetical protein CFP56_62239 [Quercus suber]
MKPRMLSIEEEAELARSNKKVKDGHHAEFKAYVKAFEFDNLMDEDEESDDDSETGIGKLREGWVSVQLTKETKQRLRGTWSKAIIVKLVGRTVSLSYIRTKLTHLWRPTGRMDCVDLGYGFFLVKFFSKEDLEAVLMGGPWFIGVWVRLCELPFELYETEVLKQIGESVGKVLRIDSHTAVEARGKYARLCIQIDINKPLVNTILIGRFEQPVSYEGLHNLCFSCGRLGHRVEACPFTIRKREEQTGSPKETQAGRDDVPHEEHASQQVPSGDATPVVCEVAETEGAYGPWMVVKRRFNGRKGTKSSLGTEGTAIPVQNFAPRPPLKISEQMGTSPSGPVFTQSTSRVGTKNGYGDHVRKGEVGWSSKAQGLRETSSMNHVSSSKMGPLKRNLIPTATHQWKLSSIFLNTLSTANASPISAVLSHSAESYFEFGASAKSGPPQQDRSIVAHCPSDRQLDPNSSNGQQSFNCVGNGAEFIGVQVDPVSREGSECEDVGDECMASEEGDGAPPTV